MKKLLLIVLIFLIMGAASAHDDLNGTDSILKDSEYNSDISDDELEVEQNSYIPVSVDADEAWSLKVYMDRQSSPVNDELINVTDDQIDIPTAVMVNGEEVSLGLGKHDIVYEFKFTNTTSVYKPEVTISDSGLSFNFKFLRTTKNPQNSIYRFTSQFTIVEATDPIVTVLNLEDIEIISSDTLFFAVNGIDDGKVTMYLDDEFFTSLYVDEKDFEEEIDTSKLLIGSYNLSFIVESGKLYGEYNINGDTSPSTVNINFNKKSKGKTPARYTAIINTVLNVRDFPEQNLIYIDAPPVDITYTRGIPIYLEGNDAADLKVFIDGEKVYDSQVQFLWTNAIYIPTKDSSGNFFNQGVHNLSFEFTPTDRYSSYDPEVSKYSNALTFIFRDSVDTTTFLNEKYIINTTLNIRENTEFIPITTQDSVTIIRTNDINLKIENINYPYNLTVFVDDVEIYDARTTENIISIKTFTPRQSIEETNERDIQSGNHKLRFEFKDLYDYDVDAEFKDNILYFRFNQKNTNTNKFNYQLNTTLKVTEKQKTVHILNVKNNTYFDDTELSVKMDTYNPENKNDWDDDDVEIPIGTQDVGIIISDENGVVYTGDDLINVYRYQKWNHDFENEKLLKAGIYTMKIINLADNTYDTVKFEVKKAKRVFTKKYSSDDFNVLFTIDFSSCSGDLNSMFYITLDNKEKSFNVKKSASNKKEVLFTDIDPGEYTATFTLKGNGIYRDVTLKSKVTVKKETPEITSRKNTANGISVTVDIPESKTGGVLIVSAGGVEKKYTVNKDTKHITADFSNLKSGTYKVKIEFQGNERYTSKTITDSIEITHYFPSPAKQTPVKVKTPPKGVGNNTGGTGTGSGDGNVPGNGNGTYNGKIFLNAKGVNGDMGSQGSGHGEAAKSYEVNKVLKKIDESSNTFLILLLITLGLLVISFIYERREDKDSEEY